MIAGKIFVRELFQSDASVWDQFVDSSTNGTIFHEMKFLGYHEPRKFDLRFLTFYEGRNRIIALLPFELKDGILKSPVGASYGGLVLSQMSLQKTYQVVLALLGWAAENGVRKIRFTYAPLIYTDRMAQDLDFVLLYCGFQNTQNLFSSVIDLVWFSQGDSFQKVSPSGRRAIKKSLMEDVQIQETGDLDSYYPILERNKLKFGVKPAHQLNEMKELQKRYPDQIKLFGAFCQENLIAGVWTMKCNSRVALAFYIASDPDFNLVRPVNRLLFEIARKFSQEGMQYLDLGVSMNTSSDNPIEPSWSLVSFKEIAGSKGFLRPSYEKSFIG